MTMIGYSSVSIVLKISIKLNLPKSSGIKLKMMSFCTFRVSIDLGGGHHVSKINDISFNNGEWHLIEVFRRETQTRVVVDKK